MSAANWNPSHVAGVDATTVTPLSISLTGDGIVTPGENGEWDLLARVNAGIGDVTSAAAEKVHQTVGASGDLADLDFNMTGTFAEVLFFLQLDAHASLDSTVDFGDTFNLDLGLPQGAVCQTASGFLFAGDGSVPVTPVSEPATLALFALGAVTLAAAGGRQTRRGMKTVG